MPKPVVKITVGIADRDDEVGVPEDVISFIPCHISSVDESWHGLKELERKDFFKKLYKLYRDLDNPFKFKAGGDSFLNSAWTKGKPLTPHPELYSYGTAMDKKRIPEQLKAIDIWFDKRKTVQELKDFFNELGFAAIVTDKYGLKGITPTTTLEDYAYKVGDAWFQKIEKESEVQSRVKEAAKQGEFPDIETYINAYPDYSIYSANKESDWVKDSAKRLTKSNRDEKGFDLLLRGRDAIEHAISDAINRMETLDINGNLERCPITLEPFEGHNKVILILSRQKDGSLQASFVQRESREGRKIIDNLPLLKKLMKNPENNNPIVALEVGTLSDLKAKYRKHIPLRPPL